MNRGFLIFVVVQNSMTFYLKILLSFILGAASLCLLSLVQKILAGYPLLVKGFYVPFSYGGAIGAILGYYIFRLQEEKEKLKLISDYANDWEYWQDEGGNFLFTSPSCESITGYLPDDFTRDPGLLEKIIDPDDLEEWRGHRHEKLQNGRARPLEFSIRTRNGEKRWIQHICRNVYDRKGKICGVRGSNRDVTYQKRLELELKTLKGLLPICSACKKIRDTSGLWQHIEYQ
jgi:PAS domain S-box-containing protein